MRGIIVEGIDCSGKSTLIKNIKLMLKKYGGFDVKELEHIECNSQYERYLYEYASARKIIFHRSHISESVFGKHLRNSTPFTDKEDEILNKIVNNDFIVILAEVNYSMFQSRLMGTKKYQVIKERDYLAITERFKHAMLNIKHFKYSSDSTDSMVKMCETVVSSLLNANH